MNGHTAFVHCVQAGMVGVDARPNARMAIKVMARASQLPEEALVHAEDLEEAAFTFCMWAADNFAPEEAPDWLKAWDEARADRWVVTVNSRRGEDHLRWWAHAEHAFREATLGNGHKVPDSCLPLLVDDATAVEVSGEDARLFEAWVKSVPGHESRPFDIAQKGAT